MNNINVILVEDLKIIRVGIKSLLRDVENITVIGDVENANGLFQLLKNVVPDILILDIQLPGMSGVEITKVIKKDFPTIKILILSASYDEGVVFHAIKSGVNGFLNKNVSKDELIVALESISAGKEYFSSQVKEIIMQNYLKSAKQGVTEDAEEILTFRECEVLKYLAVGHSISETANILCVSYSTVTAHKVKIMNKLHIKTNVDLVKYAIKNNIIEL